jgi:hypothetical protein
VDANERARDLVWLKVRQASGKIASVAVSRQTVTLAGQGCLHSGGAIADHMPRRNTEQGLRTKRGYDETW